MPTSTKKKTGAKRPSRKARTGSKRSAPGAKPRRRASAGKAAPKKAAPKKAAPKKAAPKKAAPKKSSSSKTSPKAAGARKDRAKRAGRSGREASSPAKGTKPRGAKAASGGAKRRDKAATPPAGPKSRKTASPRRGQSSAGQGRSFVAGAASPGSSNRVPTTSVESQPPTTQRSRAGAKGAKKDSKALRSSLDPPKPPQDKRNFGLRGAAPWVARHAAKHAAELRRRNAQPPPPGSARATLREPEEAAQIKADVGQLHQRTTKIRSLCRRLDRTFFEVGELLAEIQREQLHVAKGYSSFEAFIDRETDLGRTNALRLIRIAHTFVRETAYDYGIERLTAALAALDGEVFAGSPSQPSSRSFSSPGLPTKPPIRYGD